MLMKNIYISIQIFQIFSLLEYKHTPQVIIPEGINEALKDFRKEFKSLIIDNWN